MDQKDSAPKQPVEEVVITMSHSRFGVYTFRAEEGKIPAAVPGALERAKKEADVRKAVADIDSQQNDLKPEMDRVRARAAAADITENANDKARAASDMKRLEQQSQELAKKREALLQSLE